VTIDELEDTWRGLHLVVRSPIPLHSGLRDGEPVAIVLGGHTVHGRILRVDRTAASLQVRADPSDLPVGSQVTIVRRIDPLNTARYADALLRADRLDSPLRNHLINGRIGVVPDDVEHAAPLDHAQSRARAAVLCDPPLAVIHGPPGTGKTWLLGHLVSESIRRGDRVWTLADSNAAVDHLAATLHARGVDVVRLGHPSRVRDDLQALTVDARLSSGPLAAAVKALVRDLARTNGQDRASRAARRGLRRQLRSLQQQAWEHAVSSAPVIAATFGTLSRVAERLPPSDVTFVDEATQATEPAVWVPVPFTQRLVLVGDPEQLGPVVKDPGNPLENSALHRLVRADTNQTAAPMLEVQYRMSEDVQALVTPIYGPAYRPAATVASARLCDQPGVEASPLTTRAHLFIDTAGTGLEEIRDPVTRSLANPGEVTLLRMVVTQLLAAGVSASDIGIAAPYAAQVQLLRKQPDLSGIEVASINAFQGRERPVMVLSWVRSNPDGSLGFVSDGRRLTVAWSRARCLLVQIGDLGTLSGVPRFADLAAQLGTDVESAWIEPWSTALYL